MSEIKEFQPGEVVRLKAGGPKMAVEQIRGDDKAECIWFVSDYVVRDTFDQVALERV